MTEKYENYEKRDMNPKYVMYFGIALVVAAVFIHLGVWWLFREFETSQARRDFRPVQAGTDQTPPEPRLQVDPQADYQEMLQMEERILNSYQWIDRDKGTARIPINRAMELLLQRGGK